MEFAHHVQSRTIVLPELRVAFLPIPKAGCTTVLWRLAELAGLTPEDFARSTAPEVSPALTVHDVGLWGPGFSLADHDVSGDDWLRFTVVRHPAARLWSAWQSKLLLREPRFSARFGDEPWFPRLPDQPGAVVEDFRAFVTAVGTGDAVDVHWAVQDDLVRQLALNHIGHVEDLDATLTVLREHIGDAAPWPDTALRENRMPLALPPGAYDVHAEAVLRDRYARDFAAFGYSRELEADGYAAWARAAAPLLPLMRAQAATHSRTEQALETARGLSERTQTAEEQLSAVESRRSGTRATAFVNREGHTDFNVRWGWSTERVEPGFTAVLRVRDEARCLPYTLPALLRATQRVVLVDNGSTDGTPGVARRVAEACDAGDRLTVLHYPFAVARCGADHLATPADSVHSLAYFYNWCFAQVRTRYALKWDGDMVLSESAVETLRDLEWQLEAGDAIVRIPRHSVYLGGGRTFLDRGLRNCEPWAWPNKPGYTFVKAMEWELPLWGTEAQGIVLPEGSCVELKFLDADEFAHWTDTNFERSARTGRKSREWAVFAALRGGELPDGVVEVDGIEGALAMAADARAMA